jgi:GNAT superfamily N-acetyltransferase
MVEVRDARAEDAAAVARVHVDGWKTAYVGLLPAEVLGQLSYQERASKWAAILGSPQPGEFTLVAIGDQGEIVGFASGGPERQELPEYQGELYALYLLPSHRGQGIGTRLFGSAVARFRQTGVSGMVVWVLEANPYRTFYVKMGGQPCARGQHAIGGKDYAIVAYSWKDLGASRERPAGAGGTTSRCNAWKGGDRWPSRPCGPFSTGRS